MTRDEWERHFADLRRVALWHEQCGLRPACFLRVGRLFAPPDAVQRRQLAELSARPSYRVHLALVTKNPLLRGVLTAIQWMQPRVPYDLDFFSTDAQAVAWLEERRGSLPALRRFVSRSAEAPADPVRRP